MKMRDKNEKLLAEMLSGVKSVQKGGKGLRVGLNESIYSPSLLG